MKKKLPKLPRLFRSSVGLYFLFLIAFAAAAFFVNQQHRTMLLVAQVVILIALIVYSRVAARVRTAKLMAYLDSMSEGMDLTVQKTPLPIVIFNSETHEMLWANERFIGLLDEREQILDNIITNVVPGFSGEWLVDGKSEYYEQFLGDKLYRIYGSIVRSERDEYIATTYWVDITEYGRVNTEYLESRPVFAILMLDNYEELLKGMTEKEKSILLSDVDEKITLWVKDSDGYLCKFDRDRYFFLFEEKNLAGYVDDKFSVLDSVRTNIGAGGVHATLSIGVGKDGANPEENYKSANLALEMALSRGGDQAVIRNRFGFEFFGGHSPHLEKRKKVKSRVIASAFGELLGDASTVFVMSHQHADFDSIGAAAGICCIARKKGKPVRIVVDMETSVANGVISRLMSSPEYAGVFVSGQEAILAADSKSLLVVVDTSRPEKVESESLLLSCTRIAVIDHHRRAATYIENATLSFHEPYASSSCELVTEMLQYLVEPADILQVEAEALLAGMALDTKNFTVNTGSRTFDAAAFLRRVGADTSDVKRLMQSDFETTTSKYAIISAAKIYRDGVAIAWAESAQSRIAIAQAADELLNIEGVDASFVLARDGDDVFVSGRSIGDINVQIILEKLGGGGGPSTAGTQIHGAATKDVVTKLLRAIDEYIDEQNGRR